MSAQALWLSLVVALAASLRPSPACADEPSGAENSAVTLSEQRAAEAFQAYSKKDFAAAVALYLQAYEASPNGSILYNIARIYDTKLGDRPLAITYYRRYIADPGAYVERIEFANQRLKQLRDAEAATTQSSDPEATSKNPEIETKAARDARSAAPASDATKRDDGWSTTRWTGVVLGTLGVAALGTGAAFGLRAMSKADTAKQLCDGNDCASQRGVDAADAANSAATISTIGFAAGGALFATGAALFVIGANQPNERGATGALQFRTRASATAVALEVSGKW